MSREDPAYEVMIFIWVLMILLHSIVLQIPPYGYMSILRYFYAPVNDVILIPAFEIPGYIPKIPYWLTRWLEVGSAAVILVPQLRRTGAIFLAISVSYMCLFEYPGWGVGDPFFALFGFILALYPGNTKQQRDRSRALLIGALAGAYLCSGLVKINAEFLSGDTLRFEVSRIFKPQVHELYSALNLYQLSAFAGIGLEILAAAVFFPTLEGLGFLAALAFHSFNGGQINWAFCVVLLPASFPFLFNWKNKSNTYWISVVIAVIGVYLFGLTASASLIPSILSSRTYSLIQILAPIAIAIGIFWSQHSQWRTRLFSDFHAVKDIPQWRWRLAAFAFCLVLTGLSRVANLPTPIGFTQFSGLTSSNSNEYLLAIHSPEGEIRTQVLPVFLPRWDIRRIFSNKQGILFGFPYSYMRNALLVQLCQRSPTLRYHFYEIEKLGFASAQDSPFQNAAAATALKQFQALPKDTFTSCRSQPR